MRKRDAAVQTFGDVDDFVERGPSLISSGDVLLLVGAGSIRTAINRLSQQLSAGVTNRSALTFRPRPTLASSPSFRAIGRRLRFAFNRHGSVVSRFRYCAARSPTRCAVSDGGNKLNYGELDDISDALSTVFKAHGIGRGTVVGVRLSASTDLIIVMLALMKIGAVYLPVDINLPADRVRYMLATAESKLVITSSKMKIGAGTAGIDLIDLETLQAELNNLHHISKAPAAPRSEDTAYICFTSGSTGYPKAIATTHRSLLSLVSDITERFGVCPDTRMALNTSISFDVSLAEMWMALYGGGQLIVAASSKPFIGEHLADFIEDNEVTHIATTPSILASLRPRALPSLACIVCAGEACPPELVDIWARGRRFINAYGPTEATIYATATECFPGKIVTIGKALAHINTYVVDTHLNQIQPGEIGELCLGGGGVAEGYIGLDQESRDKFVILRQEGKTIDRVYKTGDVVRLDQDGNFIFLGRLDNQIKLLGNRIELEEIEHSLRRIPGIADAAICLDDSGASKKLVCFAVTDDDQATDWAKISESLLEWLPSYMLPTHFVRVRSIPLTSNGKKDRRALIAKHQAKFNGQVEYAPPRNDIEANLVSIWKDILEVEGDIGVYDNFAAVGGDSLKSLLLIEEVEQKFGVRAPPGYFGRITTITRIAVQVAELLWVGDQQRVTERPGFLASRIYKQMRDLTADWTGTRARDTSLIASYGGENAIYDLFLCVQYEVELLALLKHLGDEFRLHGIRSGHLVMDYSPDNIDQLCSYYVEELKQIAPTGKLVMGGVCQGGVIAHAMACRLQKHGDEGTPLILVEQAKLLPFSGKAAFFYAENSFLNPFKRYESGTARYDDVYGVRYSLDILPGEHGGLFNEPTVQFLVQKLRSRIL
jgi:amino acid adenylation domain-containing protein